MRREEADRALRRAGNLAAQLRGRRDTLAARRQEVADGVALAKARADARPDLDDVLEELQAELSQRTVKLYSDILTQLVRDVKLPRSRGVGIELRLGMERGLPSLDIVAVRDGNAVDIMDKAGGALTNIVCLGLRCIATICTPGRLPFLALDEADCWVKPNLVENFYAMLGGLTERFDLQSLVISHHDASLFAKGINLLVVDGDPEAAEGVSVSARPGAPPWPDEDVPGLRWMRLRNFACYRDATFTFSPGMNAIIGENDNGKSRPLAALRNVAYDGSPNGRDGDIRHGHDRCDVDIGLPRGRVLSWSRKPKRNPVELWRLAERDGSVAVLDDGTRCETGGKDGVPKWVSSVLGISKVDGIDVQLLHQKAPVFLLNETPSRRALILSIGGEVSAIRDMIAASKEDKKADALVVKAGEQEVARLMGRLSELESLEELNAALATLDGESQELAKVEAALQEAGSLVERASRAAADLETAACRCAAVPEIDEPDLRALLDRIADAQSDGVALARGTAALADARAQAEACFGLPDDGPETPRTDEAAEDGQRLAAAASSLRVALATLGATAGLPDEGPEAPATDDAIEAADRLAVARGLLDRATNVLAVAGGLADDTPEPPATDAAEAAGEALRDAAQRLAAARDEASRALAEEADATLELSDALAGMGNLCPTCGTPGITHDHIIAAGD